MPNSFLDSVAGDVKKPSGGNKFLETATPEQHFYTPEVQTAVENVAVPAPIVPSESRGILKSYTKWSQDTGKGIANFFMGGPKTEQELNLSNTSTPLPTKTFFDKFKEIKDQPAQVLPFLQGGNEAAHAIELYNAGKRLEDDTASARDVALMRDYIKRSQQDTSWGYDVANLVTQSIPFMAELGLTGGIYTAARKGAQKGTEIVLKKFLTEEGQKLLEKRAVKFALKASAVTAGATAQTVPSMFMNIGASTVEKMTPVYNFTEDEAGKVTAFIERPGEDFGGALTKALGESWVETVSERTGGVLNGLGPKIKEGAFRSAFVKAWFTGNVGVTTSKKLQMLNKLMERVGWNGVVGEMFEERVGDVMHGILAEAGLSDQEFKRPTMKQLSTELVGFAVPGTVFAGAGGLLNKGKQMKWEKDTEKVITESGLADDINNALTVHPEEDVKKSIVEQTGVTEEHAQQIMDIARGVKPADAGGILNADDVASEVEAIAKAVETESRLQAEDSQALADQMEQTQKDIEEAVGSEKKYLQKELEAIRAELAKRTDDISKQIAEAQKPEEKPAKNEKGLPYKGPKFEKKAQVTVTPKDGGESVRVEVVGQREDGIIAKGQEGVQMLYTHERFDVAPVEKTAEEKQIERDIAQIAKESTSKEGNDLYDEVITDYKESHAYFSRDALEEWAQFNEKVSEDEMSALLARYDENEGTKKDAVAERLGEMSDKKVEKEPEKKKKPADEKQSEMSLAKLSAIAKEDSMTFNTFMKRLHALDKQAEIDKIIEDAGYASLKAFYNKMRVEEMVTVEGPRKTEEVDVEQLIKDARDMGRNAFARGITRAPAQDPAILELIKDKSQGVRMVLMKEWTTGWDKENLKPAKKEKGPIDTAYIAEQRAELQKIYDATGPSDIEGYTKADAELNNLLLEMDLAEAGQRSGFTNLNVNGPAEYVNTSTHSTFPEWLDEDLRSRDLFDNTVAGKNYTKDMQYPSGNKARQRRLIDGVLEQLDIQLDIDTSAIRNNILEAYEGNITRSEGQDTQTSERSDQGEEAKHRTKKSTPETFENKQGDIAPAQKNKLAKVIMQIAEANGFDLNANVGESLLSVENPPYMDLSIERQSNKVFISHIGIQNGDVMRDPEIMLEIVDGQMIPRTFTNDYARVKDSPVKPNEEIVKIWASNLVAQGFTRGIIKDNGQPTNERRDTDSNGPEGVSETGDVPTGTSGESGESVNDLREGELADRVEELGARPVDTTDVIEEKIGKKGRQSINDQVKALLEAKNYSTNREDYTADDIGLLKLYSGAGGKESAGAEGKGLLSEFYTPNKVVQKTWELALQYAGNVETAFEPSAGTGRYIMLRPEGVAMDGIELDLVSGTVAQIINEDSNIEIGDFQSIFFQKEGWPEYDLVIGNPPYGARGGFIKGKGEEPKIDRWEEYFIKRGLDLTKEGGTVAYVVNSSFLQKGGSKGKEAIAKLGKLVAAYRLPEGTFEDTSIGTDIVIFRKEDTTSLPSSTRESIMGDRMRDLNGDGYFEYRKENILGETKTRTNRFGKEETYVTGDLSALDAIKADVKKDPATIVQSPKADPKPAKVKSANAKNAKKGTKKNPLKQIYEGKKGAKTTKSVISATGREYTQAELDIWKRTERDGSISGMITEPQKKMFNFAGGKWYSDTTYYSGNISQRLAQLELDKVQMETNQYESQKAKLLAIKPTELAIEDISFDPLDRHIMNLKNGESTILRGFTNYLYNNNVPLPGGIYAGDITRLVTGGNMRKDTKTLMPQIKDSAKRLFNLYVKEMLPEDLQQRIVTNYNETKNSVVNQRYADIPVVIEGMSKTFKGKPFELSATQKRGVAFLVQKGAGLLAWGVGVGKTLGIATATVGNMQAGRTKRPMIAVPKATIDQTWIDTFQQAFPGITLVNLSGLTADVVRKLRAERGEVKDWVKDGEIAIISHNGLMRLGFKEDELRGLVADLNDALWSEAKPTKTKRGEEEQKDKIDEIAGHAQRFAKDIMISDLGIDHISVDEVHNHRKVFQGAKASKEDGAYGQQEGGKKRFASVIGGTPSARAVHLFLTTQYIQKKYGGNVFLASATPFENHATEVYNILSFVARDRMKEMGIFNINDFFAAFADFVPELEIDMQGKAVMKEKMKNFKNLPALQSLLREYVDRREDPTLIRPERRVMTPILGMSALQEENLAKIQMLLAGEVIPGEEGLGEILGDGPMMSTKEKEDGAFLVASQFSIANSVSPYFVERWTDQNFTPEDLVENSPKIKYAMELIKKLRQDPKTKNYGTFLYFGKHGKNHHQKVKDYIVANLGFKENEVEYINGDIDDDERETIKDNFNTGEVKVLIGGDPTKEGIDLQNNGYVTINLALGWNPTEPAQVEGRVWRQGNKRSIAPLVYPLVENSGDVMIYGKFEEKGGRINDLFSYQGDVFDVAEIDPQQKKIALLTNPEAKAQMEIEYDRARLDNERVGILTEQKNLQNLGAELGEAERHVERVTRWITEGEQSDDTRLPDWRKERDKYKAKVKRIQESFVKKNVVSVDSSIETLKKRVEEIEAQMKTLSDTYAERLTRFTNERAEEILNRKTIDSHVEDFFTATADLEERTAEEIAAMRKAKMDELAQQGPNLDFKRRDSIGRFAPENIELLTEKEIAGLNEIQRENYDKFVAPQIADIPFPQEDERVVYFSGHQGEAEQYVDTDILRALNRGTLNNFFVSVVPKTMLKSTGFEEKDKAGERKLVSQVSFKKKELTTKILTQLEGKKTISKQFIADATKQADIKAPERDLINRMLADEGDTVNVPAFIDKVKMELLPLDFVSSAEGEPRYENVTLSEDVRGEVENYEEHVYNSPIATSAGNVHFSGEGSENYFAHTRIEDMEVESSKSLSPDQIKKMSVGMSDAELGKRLMAHDFGVVSVRRIIEIQSDLFQKGRLEQEFIGGRQTSHGQNKIDEFSDVISNSKSADEVIEKWGEMPSKELIRATSSDFKGKAYSGADEKSKIIDELLQKSTNDTVTPNYAKLEPYRNAWQDRIIREEVKQAAIDGKTKLQFPTGETAMQIEGLGQEDTWMVATDNSDETGSYFETGANLKDGDLHVGQRITMEDRAELESNDLWVITEVLGDGKFKAVPKDVMDAFEAGELKGTKQKIDDYVTGMTESFDISDNVDKENPIYKFYEKEVAKYLRNKYGAKLITDDQGVTWNEVTITGDMAGPVEAFKTLDEVEAWLEKKIAGRLIGKEQTLAILQQFKDRLGIDFNVQFYDRILTGEKTPALFALDGRTGDTDAWGVTVTGAMAFTEKTEEVTPAHEVVHFVLNNLDQMPEFGVTKAELNALVDDETIARGFETYWKKGQTGNFTAKVVAFFQKLATMIREILGMEVTQAQALQRFYYDVMYMRRFGPTVRQRAQNLKPYTYVRNNELILDFEGFRTMAEPGYKRKTVPEDLVVEADPLKMDLIRKDINLLNDITAQARDIYLKDKQEFKGADIFQTVADTRRIKKGAIDRRFADMLAPYFDLGKDEKATLNIALTEGDRQTRKWNKTELATYGVTTAKAIGAYYKTREAFEYAHDMLIAKMEENGVKEEEIDQFRAVRVGYVPHRWEGRYVVKTQEKNEDGGWKTVSMQDYKTEGKARRAYEELESNENTRYVLDTLDSVDVDFFTAQHLTAENVISAINRSKVPEEFRQEVVQGIRDLSKEKGFGRYYIRRTNISGYETENLDKVFADYFSGLAGYVTKMEAAPMYFKALQTIDPRRQKKFYAWLRDTIAYDMGNSSELNAVKQTAFIWMLANDISYLIVNATQNMTVGTGELSKYVKGAKKIAGAEMALMGAMTSWWTGRISDEERGAVEFLLKNGRLGGEMTSELMGYKSNPIYRTISNTFAKALYSSTSFVESNINRVPAFIAARRILLANGADPATVDRQALSISDDIHFRYGKQNRPRMERGRAGALFVFTHWTRSFLYQLSRDLSQREFMALGKKMFYTAVLGGALSLPFAKMWLAIYKEIVGDDDDELKKELSTWELALTKGVPAVFGADLSGRVSIDIFQFGSILSDPTNIVKWGGAGASMIDRFSRGYDLAMQERYYESAAKLVPDGLGGNFFKAYAGYTYGVRSQAGKLLERSPGVPMKYTPWEAALRGIGFTPTEENLAWEKRGKVLDKKEEESKESSIVRRKIETRILSGDTTGARELEAKAKETGTLGENSTPVEDYIEKPALMKYAGRAHAGENLVLMKKAFIAEVYPGEKLSPQKKAAIDKKFDSYAMFGPDNELVTAVLGGKTNEDRVEVLLKARQEMGATEFAVFFGKAKRIKLISDDLAKLYRKAQAKALNQ